MHRNAIQARDIPSTEIDRNGPKGTERYRNLQLLKSLRRDKLGARIVGTTVGDQSLSPLERKKSKETKRRRRKGKSRENDHHGELLPAVVLVIGGRAAYYTYIAPCVLSHSLVSLFLPVIKNTKKCPTPPPKSSKPKGTRCSRPANSTTPSSSTRPPRMPIPTSPLTGT